MNSTSSRRELAQVAEQSARVAHPSLEPVASAPRSGEEAGRLFSLDRVFAWLLEPPVDGPVATILVRSMVGGVFLSEGILKFVYTNQGVGRFTKLGFPAPELTANFVAILEIVGGALLIAGFLTRLVAIPFVIEMVVAMLTTKVALFLGTSPLPLPPSPPQTGLWAVLHETRSDYAQIMGSLFLLWAGPGLWSADARWARRRKGTADENR